MTEDESADPVMAEVIEVLTQALDRMVAVEEYKRTGEGHLPACEACIEHVKSVLQKLSTND